MRKATENPEEVDGLEKMTGRGGGEWREVPSIKEGLIGKGQLQGTKLHVANWERQI